MPRDDKRVFDEHSQESETQTPSRFTFEADDRAFVCQIEGGQSHLRQWWWFTVSGEAHRFAPFQPSSDDTLESVRCRIVSYYRELVARRALVLDQREEWELRRKNLAALKAVRRG
ncbi:MAG TPA: hypothetical protein VJN70_10605 [Gemmatimonadaceae bacterium]|nr:hypothetical protein [Gemmatimonadaceae bacterium]